MLWFVCFFNYADRQAIMSVFPKFQEEFGFSETQLGLIGSAFMWVYAAGAPIAGFIADRFRRKDLILGGCAFWSFITVTTSWCTQLWQFVTVRALEGVGETFYFPASMSLVSDYHDRRTRSRALSLHQSSVYLGTIGGSWFAAWLAQHYNWRLGFYFFGVAGLVLALVLYGFLREPKRGSADATPTPLAGEGRGEGAVTMTIAAEAPGVIETLRIIFRTPTAVLLMLAFLAANFVATIFLTWTPTFLVKKFHFELAAAGLSGSVYIHIASALAAPLGGVLADQLTRRLFGGRIAVQLAGLAIGSGFVFLVGSTGDRDTLIASMCLFGLCKGLYDSNIFASLYDVIEPRARATAAGIMNTVGWGGGAVGPLYVGYMAEHGRHADKIENMSEAIALGGGVYILGAILLLIATFTARRDVPTVAAIATTQSTRPLVH
jgi:MFS family permease